MSLFTSLPFSASGMTAQRRRAEVLVENLQCWRPPVRPKEDRTVGKTSSSVQPSIGSLCFAVPRGPGGSASGVAVSGVVLTRAIRNAGMSRAIRTQTPADTWHFPESSGRRQVDLDGRARGYQANVAAMTR